MKKLFHSKKPFINKSKKEYLISFSIKITHRNSPIFFEDNNKSPADNKIKKYWWLEIGCGRSIRYGSPVMCDISYAIHPISRIFRTISEEFGPFPFKILAILYGICFFLQHHTVYFLHIAKNFPTVLEEIQRIFQRMMPAVLRIYRRFLIDSIC